ncbi:MAG: hypothetical protein F4138_06960 [Acidimicrobiia bacterium]|nr:hypothetical protein [Acidimicrobiia bacterium]
MTVEISPNWRTVQLHEVCQPKQWQTIKKSEMTETGFPVYGANGIIGRYHSFNHTKATILIGCRGTCGAINVCEPNSWVTGNAMALDDLDTSRVDFNFMVYALKTDELQNAITGTSQPQITQTSLKRIHLPLPPIQEQRRIAAVLDAAEALREKRRQTLVRLNSLVQSIFINMFGDPVRNEYDWPTVRLGDVAIIERKAVYPGEVNNQEQYVGLENITSNGAVEGVTTAGKADLKSSKFAFNDDHLLYGKLRPYLTKIAAPKFGGICSTDILPIKPGDSLYRYYLLYCLRTPAMVAQATNNAVGINLPRLSPTVLESFEIPLPPIETQRCFDSVVQEIHQQHKTLKTQAHLLDTLFDSLRQRAFRGEL